MNTYNPNVFTSKSHFVNYMVRDIREHGGIDFWVLNKTYYEIYHFKGTQISDFDVQIDLYNSLAQEHILNATFVIHMKDKITLLLEQIPGKVYINKLECYRELYQSLNEKIVTIKNKRIKDEIEDKIEFLETEFPELII